MSVCTALHGRTRLHVSRDESAKFIFLLPWKQLHRNIFFRLTYSGKKSKKQNALADTLIAEVRGQEVLIGGCQLSPCDPQC